MISYRYWVTPLLCAVAISLTWSPKTDALDEAETMALLIRAIQKTQDSDVQASLMQGMLDGLEGRRNVPKPAGWAALGQRLRSDSNERTRKLANRLSQIFGDEQAIAEALESLRDGKADPATRLIALKSLVTQKHKELPGLLESLLDTPELQLEAIRAYGVMANDKAPQVLLERFPKLGEPQQRAIIETLATRKNYAAALVGGLRDGIVDRKKIPSYLARSMRDLLGRQFTDVYGEIQEMKQDTKVEIAKFKKLITPKALASADPSRGRAVFQKTCAACHWMYDAGGKIGPDLTGSNRKNLDYVLLNSIDPSADVPKGYRMVIVQTEDGRVLNGVIAEENSQRLILKTVDQPRLVIAKSDIETRKVSPKSMMPDGQLQQLKRRELFDLIRYLQTTQQVELPQ